MNSQEHYIIHRLNLEINTNSKQKAYELNAHVSEWLSRVLLPYLEKYFQQIGSKGHFRYENLSLEIESKDWSDEVRIKEQILDQLNRLTAQNRLDINGKEAKFSENFKNHSQLEVFKFFLENGFLPWFASSDFSVDEQIEILLTNESAEIQSLLPFLVKNQTVLQRFLNHISEVQIHRFFNVAFQLEQNSMFDELYFDQLFTKRADRLRIYSFLFQSFQESYTNTSFSLPAFLTSWSDFREASQQSFDQKSSSNQFPSIWAHWEKEIFKLLTIDVKIDLKTNAKSFTFFDQKEIQSKSDIAQISRDSFETEEKKGKAKSGCFAPLI